MLKRLISLSLAVALLSLGGFNPLYVSAQESDAKSAAKVRGKVAEIGTGPRAKVEVKLRDGAKVKGYISEIGEDYFTVADKKAGEVKVAYSEVKSLRERYIPKWMKVTSLVALGLLAPIIISSVVVVAKGGQ
jgi:hypothetical protein